MLHLSQNSLVDTTVFSNHSIETLTRALITTSTPSCNESAEVQSTIKVKTLSLAEFHNLQTRPAFLQAMRQSLMEIGTFYIKDHGISTQMTTKAMKTVQEYFSLPIEEKKKMIIGNTRHFRGYKLIGDEFTNNQVDHREQLQFGPEQTPNLSFRPSVSQDYEGLQGPNQWPVTTLELLPSFQPTILDFMDELETLSQHLMEAVALSLGLKGSYFREMFGQDPYYRLKCAKYPSVQEQVTIGCGAHKDTGFLTVLLQDMVGGLQGQDPASGQWMETKPIPETFIVTMGESIERLTGGLYHGTVHRVLNNTSGQDRYSIPFFFDPSLSAQIPKKIQNLAESAILDFTCEKQDMGAEENSSTQPTWSNGAHVFETVNRCHPEVYARWYNCQ